MKNKNTEKFCHSILGLGIEKSKDLANLVMGLASQMTNPYANSGYLPANAANDIWNNYYKFLSDARLFDKLTEDFGEDD